MRIDIFTENWYYLEYHTDKTKTSSVYGNKNNELQIITISNILEDFSVDKLIKKFLYY
jgi:hypothetical protein